MVIVSTLLTGLSGCASFLKEWGPAMANASNQMASEQRARERASAQRAYEERARKGVITSSKKSKCGNGKGCAYQK